MSKKKKELTNNEKIKKCLKLNKKMLSRHQVAVKVFGKERAEEDRNLCNFALYSLAKRGHIRKVKTVDGVRYTSLLTKK